MFPTPQSALPLPPHPLLAHYRKLAKELVRAAQDDHALVTWASRWIEALMPLAGRSPPAHLRREWLEGVTGLARDEVRGKPAALARAQHVLARSHGFTTWARFAETIDRLRHADSGEARFEAAADAVVAGALAQLAGLLEAAPALVKARSARAHRATLLHYVSANGVERYRQKSPKNAVEVAEVLLDRGAEVAAVAEVYGSSCTTLELVATSEPPRAAGVQLPLLETLLGRRASLGSEERARALMRSCLANGQPDAARYLAGRGAPLELATAAGLGRLELVTAFFSSTPKPEPAELSQALVWACFYAPPGVAALLLDHGVPIASADRFGQTGLHCAAMARRPELVRLLLGRGAPLEVVNSYGGTPLGQALWSAAHSADPDGALEVLTLLLDAGARLPEDLQAISPRIDALLRSAR